MTSVKDHLNHVNSYLHDATGHRTKITRPPAAPGGAAEFTCNPAAELTSVKEARGDNSGRRTSITFPAATNGTRTCRDDQLDRLASRGTSGSLNSPYGTNFYWNLDDVGNRTSTSYGGTSTTYTQNSAQLNQYSNVGGSSLAYDTRGNLTSDGSRTMTYDTDNRLTTVVKSGTTVNYTYDFAHRIAKRSVGVLATRYIYDQNWNVLAEINSTGATTRLYLHGPSVDEVLAQVSGGGATVDYLLKDHLGSTTALYRPGSGVQQRFTYNEYGAVPVRDAAGTPSAAAPVTRYLFTGREFDVTTGLYHYRHRWYHPETGRFVSPDPIGFGGGDVNHYAYVKGNPLNAGDPLGLAPPGFPGDAKVKVDMQHVKDRHCAGGKDSKGKNLWPKDMNKNSILAAIREAYKDGKKQGQPQETTNDKGGSEKRQKVKGECTRGTGKLDVEMWVNLTTGTIETAYPPMGPLGK